MRYFLDISYLGTDFSGWQSQKNAISVQQVIEDGIRLLFGVDSKLVASGRTDAGVHARQQIAHLEVSEKIDVQKFSYRLNGILPASIAINQVYPVADDMHARFSAKWRSYEYHLGFSKNPFRLGQQYVIKRNLDFNAMNQAAGLLIGEHDFSSFSRVKTDVTHFRCVVRRAEWEVHNSGAVFHVTANRFLRGMVRALVGTLIWVGEQKVTITDFTSILEARDRKAAGPAAPAQGLFLTNIEY